MERYRSGHNGAVLKTVRRQRHRGSNPLLSATSEQSPLRSKTDSSFELSVFSLRPQNWLTKQRRRGLHTAAAIFCAFICQPSFLVLYCSMRQINAQRKSSWSSCLFSAFLSCSSSPRRMCATESAFPCPNRRRRTSSVCRTRSSMPPIGKR